MEPHRKAAVKRYNSLYKRVSGIDWTECYYCGSKMHCFDHVPPIGKLENYDIKILMKRGVKFLLYPSCNTCNAILGSNWILDPIERINFIALYYLERVGGGEVWTDAEMAELGHSLRSLIESTQNRLQYFNMMAARLFERADRAEGRYENE